LNSPDQPQPDFREIAPSYYRLLNQEFVISEQEFCNLYGSPLPERDHKPSRPYDEGNTLEDISHTLIGKLIIKVADQMSKKVTKASKEEEGMMSSMIKEMPFHSLVTTSDGIISEPMMEGIIDFLNGHYLKGIRKLFKKRL
jgi:beta-glucosidase